jgi:hypothetical protein
VLAAVTYPAAVDVRSGNLARHASRAPRRRLPRPLANDVSESERPLEATLWGEPPCGRAVARLADGSEVRWTRGEWSASPGRDVAFAIR